MKTNNSHDLYPEKSRVQKNYYDQTAKNYDRWHIEPASAKIVDGWNFSNLKKFIGARKIFRALDLGCGTGRLANSLLSITAEVYGLDFSKEVIKIAQQKYPALKLTCGQVVDLPYDNDIFDLVVINGSLHHFFAVERTLKESRRVLKPGGFFVLLGEPNSQFLKLSNIFFYIWLLNRIVVNIISFFKINKSLAEDIEPEAESYVPARLREIIEAVGFKVVKFYTYDYLTRSESKWWLKHYRAYLDWEHKNISLIVKNRGAAIQCFAIKK
ncbi:MAG: hypothetical protein C3F02_04435 [Parcubacteria group bacterium]|nr:MAG: hypothetical protein C3F02_04435 [Parcubacteria group bacterium]